MSASALPADSSIFSLVDSGDYFGDEELAAMFSVVAINVECDKVDDNDDKLENFFPTLCHSTGGDGNLAAMFSLAPSDDTRGDENPVAANMLDGLTTC